MDKEKLPIKSEGQKVEGPLFTPGPGWGERFSKWMRSNFFKIVLPIIIIALAVVLLIIFLGKKESEKAKEISTPTPKITEVEKKEDFVKKVDGKKIFVMKAQKGEGITHLARRSLKKYLDENPLEWVKAEHKIYIEDYLKDLHGERLLEIGEEIEFNTDDIAKAIEKANGLSEKDLSNLSKYVLLVTGI